MLTIDIDGDGIALVTIDMPGRSMNVIDWPLLDALDAAARRLAADAAVSGIVLTSGKGSFIAGADLAIMEDLSGLGITAGETARRAGRVGEVFRRIEGCGKPVVAAAPGTALGGGFELMLACHHRIAADTPKAVFGLPEVKLGLLPGAGGTQRLPRLIGIAEALPLLLEGRALKATEAQAAGLIDAVVPPDDLIDAAKAALREKRVSASPAFDQKGFRWPGAAPASPVVQELFALFNARTLAATRGLYPAPQAILSCVFEGARLPMDAALKVERDYFATLVRGSVSRALIRTLFFARQASDKAGRRAGDPADALVKAGRAAYVAEGLLLAQEDVPAALIDNTALAAGMAKGPLELARADGLNVPEAGNAAGAAADDVRDRLLFAPALAVARAAGDAAPELVDLDAVLGWGFPAWTGGPLFYLSGLGRATVEARCAALQARHGGRFAPPA